MSPACSGLCLVWHAGIGPRSSWSCSWSALAIQACIPEIMPNILSDTWLGAQAGGEPDDSKLYVAHLPPTMDDDNLRRLFSTYGVVRALGATFFLHFGPRSWLTWL